MNQQIHFSSQATGKVTTNKTAEIVGHKSTKQLTWLEHNALQKISRREVTEAYPLWSSAERNSHFNSANWMETCKKLHNTRLWTKLRNKRTPEIVEIAIWGSKRIESKNNSQQGKK